MTPTKAEWIRPILVGLIVLLVGLAVHGLARPVDDGAVDRVVVEAAWSGLDPYRPIFELYDSLGYDGEYPGVAPRPPGAFIVQAPSLLLPVEYAGLVNVILGSAAVAGLAALCGRRGWLAVVVMAGPILAALWYGQIAFIYMFLIAWSLQGREWWRGVPLGVVAAVRLWPGLIILALWLEGRRRQAVTAGVVMVGLNLAGLQLVSFGEAVNGLTQARDFFAGAPWPIWLLPALALIAVFKWRGAALPLAIAASPITWGFYYLSALPQTVTRKSWGPLIVIGVTPWVAVGLGVELAWAVAAGGLWLAWQWRNQPVSGQMSDGDRVGGHLDRVAEGVGAHS